MALGKEQALDAVRAIMHGPRAHEAERLERIHRALQPRRPMDGFVPTVEIPKDAPEIVKRLARKTETNYLPLLVKTYAQVIKADGYYSQSDQGAEDPWVWWQRNRMDSRQTGLIRSALQYGVGYSTVLPGTYGRGLPGPSIALFSPREMTAVYADPEADEWPMLAFSDDQYGTERLVRLYDDELVYTFSYRAEHPFNFPLPSAALRMGSSSLTYLTEDAHETGVCPVIRWRDRNLLSGEEQYGIVEPLMTVQERIDETEFQGAVARYFQAFMQRYVLGWVPETEAEEFKAGAARTWYLDVSPDEVKIDQLEGADGKAHSESAKDAKRDFAALGQIPVQNLGVDGISNISDATLAGLETGKNRERGEIQTSLGEAGEQMLRLCAYIDGNEAASNDYSSELRWADMEARAFAATIDGLSKAVTTLGLDPEIALEDLPNMTEQKLARAKAYLAKKSARERLEAARATAGQVRQDPTVDALMTRRGSASGDASAS